MSLISLYCLLFLCVVLFIYYEVLGKFQWIVLLVASYYFYFSFGPALVLWLTLTTIISYICGRVITENCDLRTKKVALIFGIVVCAGFLFIFKYFNFFSENTASFLKMFSISMDAFTLQLILPVGMSFYTFKVISYMVDVYRGTAPQNHLGYYALYVSFFPQLIAGPIDRTGYLLPQFEEQHYYDKTNFESGVNRILLGLFKKLVIADSIAIYVNNVYGYFETCSGLALVFVSLFFTVQIYCDFSGYSDIAIGTATLLGIRVKENFRSPYFSKNIREFWGRWHISLSSWFRDYVYIPMGGGRVSEFRKQSNILITFLLCGLWHGTNWTFIFWGGLHAVYLISYNLFLRIKLFLQPAVNSTVQKIVSLLSCMLTFLAVSFAWIFFRANSLGDAFAIIEKIVQDTSITITQLSYAIKPFTNNDECITFFLTAVLFIFILFVKELLEQHRKYNCILQNTYVIFMWNVFLMVSILLFGTFGSDTFIYAQF